MTKRVKSPSNITEEENDQKRIRSNSGSNSTLLNIRGGDTTTTSTDSNMQTEEDNKPSWGDYLGGWKLGASIDQEAERIDRQKAAFGHETIARLKDLNVLIILVTFSSVK